MTNISLLSAAHTHTKGFLNAIRDKDDVTTAVIWDDMEDRGQRYADEYDCDYSSDLDGVLAREDIEGFIICSENTRHLPLLRAAIPVGKPIFCEKPFVTSTQDAREALGLVREHGTTVHMGYFQPFAADVQGVIAHLGTGSLGKLTHARYRNAHHAAYGRWFDSPDLAWFADPELAGGGAFMDMGTHAVHLLRSLLGPVARASAVITNVSGIYTDVDDNGVALLEFASGVIGTIEASWVQTGGTGGLEVTGSEATLYRDPETGFVTAKPREDPVAVASGEEKPTRVDRLVAAIRGELTSDELDSDLTCAADSVAIMEACYRSNESGRWEDVEKLN